ncbi:MAG TPA: anion permease [Candidatus Dormibacteraeota bacterium]|jgi:PiT family inorganic phosphate transporter|nr:anion permease [Candidatus Dormibacteraeota bacterium]
MTDPLDIASLIIAGLLAMVVSGNNLSACAGTIIGSGIVRRRTGVVLAVAGYLAGLVLEGPKLFRVREVFLPTHTPLAGFSILLASLLVFVGGDLLRVPLSLSKALTGSILGVSVALGTFYQTGYLALILGFWFLVPLAATGLGIVLIVLDDLLSPRNLWLKLTLLKAGLLPLAFLSAYVLGVNTLGLIAGIPYNRTLIATIAVGIGCVVGAFLLGGGALRRLTEGIFSLRYPNAFYAQLVGSATVELANQFAVPLSITETVSSGIIGSGLARRMRVLNVHNIFLIISSWVLSPIIGFLLAFILVKVLA